MDKSIALIGYRGSGKTTVGRELAAMLNLPFLDTDEMIVKAAGKPIGEIFSDEGEERFREFEKKIIHGLGTTAPSIISVGGGAVINPENVAVLRSVATIIWLTAPADVLVHRTLSDTKSPETRPPLTDQSLSEEVEQILRHRIPLYEQAAEHSIDTEGRTAAEIAASILGFFQAE